MEAVPAPVHLQAVEPGRRRLQHCACVCVRVCRWTPSLQTPLQFPACSREEHNMINVL